MPDTPTAVTRIGKYEVLAELGRGGMGVVYRAEDKNIGREVAIKTLTDVTPELRQRFLVEARSGVLNHQNIVTVYDFGEQDGSPYIVMEYLQGDSLEKVLRAAHPLALVEKLEIVRQVCEGLGYAHSKGVVHRDIKPANIMLLPGGQVKIVDFGIARLESSTGQTKTGAVIGTFHYISPERLKGEMADGRADIWACGIMLYQMLTGVLPFGGEDISALHKVVNEPFPPLTMHLSDYPMALDQVMERALAKQPNDRYASAEEMAGDLEAIAEVLKRARVGEMLGHVRVLLEQDQLSAARPLLLDLQRLDPQNSEIKRQLREVQDRLSRQQRSEQVRQLLNLAEEAVLNQRYADALDLYKQALRVDPNIPGMAEKVSHVQGLKEKVDRIAHLTQQANDARQRKDFTAASLLIDQALQLDERNTDLRNEKARLALDQDRAAKEGLRRRLMEVGREKLSGRAFTEAIQNLREALQIDPTDAEAQQMFQEATSRQEEERRRKVIEQIVAEIQEHLFRGELERGLELIYRALDRLPAETGLLRLRAETEKRLREENARRVIDETSLKVQDLLLSDPQEALSCVQHGLSQVPGEERLLALQERVVAQLKKANLAGLRAQYLKHAQEAIEAVRFDQAMATLETAALDCGDSPEIEFLREHARAERQRVEKSQATAAVLERARDRVAAEDLQGALAILRPAAQQTGNLAVEQLLRQTQERLDEITRRLETLVGRVRTLSETDPGQALQLIQSQPADVQQHSQVKELRIKLDARLEQGRVTRQAVEKSLALLQKKDLRGGLEVLEGVQRAYGSSPDLAAATMDYVRRRGPVATEIVDQSVTAARQAILDRNGPGALEELRRSADVLEFADADSQADWNRLAQEAAKTVSAKRNATDTLPIVVQPKGLSMGIVAAVAAVLLVIAGILIYKVVSGSGGKRAAAPLTYLQLNATPFAEVVSVTDKKGGLVPLPGTDHTTPLRLDGVAEGSYTVVFKAQDGTSTSATCALKADADHLCVAPSKDLSDAQIDEILAGKQ